MALTIDELEIQIQADAKKANDGIDSLIKTMEKLNSILGKANGISSGLSKISEGFKSFGDIGKLNLNEPIQQIQRMKEAINAFSKGNGARFRENIKDIVAGFSSLSSVEGLNISSAVREINKLSSAAKTLESKSLAKFPKQMRKIASGFTLLENVGNINISSSLNALRKIPETTEQLKPEVIARFADKIKELTTVMAPLAVEMEKVSAGFKALPSSMSTLINSNKDVKKSNNSVSLSFKNVVRNLARTVASYMTLYYAIRRVANTVGEWLKESNDYVENLNLFRVAMGDTAAEAEVFAKSVGEAIGIDPSEWMKNQGVFQQMAQGFGVTSEKATIMSKNLTQLAYDLSSYFNTDVETAMDKLQSGMSGQIKGLKEFGINLSVAALQETAYSLGIDQSVRSMTEAEKAQLRYITLIQRTNGIMGDMAKTIDSPANQLRILNAQFTQLRRALGNLVSVLVTKWIPYLLAAVELITEFVQGLAEASGWEPPEQNMDFEVDVDTGGLDDVEDQIEEIKSQLMGFDELNILSDGKKNENSLSWLEDFELPSYDFIGELEKIDLEPFKKEVEEVSEKVLTLLATVLEVKTGFAAWEISSKLGLSIGSLSKTFSGGAIGAIVTGVPMALGAVYDAVVNGFDWINGILIPLGATLSGAGIGAIIGALGGPIGAGIGALIGLAVGALTDLGIVIYENWGDISAWFKKAWDDICSCAVGAWEGVKYAASVAADATVNAWHDTSDFFVGLWNDVSGWAVNKAWPVIVQASEDAAECTVNAWNDVSTFFSGLWSDVSTWATDKAWPKIQEAWGNVSGWFSENVGKPIGDFFTDTFKGIKEKWSDFWSGLEIKIKLPHFEWTSKPAEGWIAKTLEALGLPSSIPKLDVKWYANGGFPSMGEMFVARERGPEMVGRIGNKSAVANNDQITRGIASAVYEAMMAAHDDGGSGGNAKIIVQIGDTAVGEAAVRFINGQIVQTGTNPIYA